MTVSAIFSALLALIRLGRPGRGASASQPRIVIERYGACVNAPSFAMIGMYRSSDAEMRRHGNAAPEYGPAWRV